MNSKFLKPKTKSLLTNKAVEMIRLDKERELERKYLLLVSINY